MRFKYLKIDEGRIMLFDENWYRKETGEIYPSTTFVLGFDITEGLYGFAKDHGRNVDFILEEKSEIGKYFHRYIEDLLRDGVIHFDGDTSNVQKYRRFIAWKRLPAFRRFYNKELKGKEIIGIEEVIFEEDLKVGGTLDLKIEYNGIVVYDWKTSNAVQEHHKMQIAVYAKAVGAREACVVIFPEYPRTVRGYSITRLDEAEINKWYEKYKKIKRNFDERNIKPAFKTYPVSIYLEEQEIDLFKDIY